MSNANLAGRANEFPLPGKLALLAFRPSRELAAFVMETLGAGGLVTKFTVAISEKCQISLRTTQR